MSFLKKNSMLFSNKFLKAVLRSATNLRVRNCKYLIIEESKRFLNTSHNNNSKEILANKVV